MDKKELVESLRQMGLLEYGKVIDGNMLRSMAGIYYPETGTKADFDSASLEELAVTDYIRNVLLNEGKYLKSHREDYRILSPSENSGQVESYMKSADHKLRRAIKLSKNTPVDAGKPKCQNMARAMMKRESISKQRQSVV